MRVNDVRVDYASTEESDANVGALTGGKAGVGRVTETAGVRGIDESDLKSAALDQAQLDAMIGNRADPTAAAAYAREHGWQATSVAYEGEGRTGERGAASVASAAPAAASLATVGGLLGALGNSASAKLGIRRSTARESWRRSPRRTLLRKSWRSARRSPAASSVRDRCGTMPMPSGASTSLDAGSPSQTSRPDLPWTFGIIDTPEVNAFAAPGGYVLVTRGLYELLASDAELAAALAHEISHCVQRDHYSVIRKQELASRARIRAARSHRR